MKSKVLVVVCLLAFVFTSCGSGNGLGNAYNITKCEYKYKSIANLTFSGMNLSKGVSPLQIPKIIALLSGPKSSMPLDFTVNLDVKNPNASAAAFVGIDYILSIDNVKFTQGKIDHSMNIAPGGSQGLPITIGFDLATLLQGESKAATENIVKNFVGIGDKKSNVSIQIKPTFMMGNVPVTSPFYIPVNFAFGGE